MSTGTITTNTEEIGEDCAAPELTYFGRVTRVGWNGNGQYLTMQSPDINSKMSLPYIFITTVQGHNVPWLASQTDTLSEDWIIV